MAAAEVLGNAIFSMAGVAAVCAVAVLTFRLGRRAVDSL